jgi:UDP:flavonoid glycosyltransferase YjiC (YdhE family)
VRVLLSSTSGAGHFRPLAPVARALVAAGHAVACAAPVEAADMVRSEGLEHLPFDGVPDDHPGRAAVFEALPRLPHAEAERLVGSEIFGRINTTFALPGAQAAVAAFRPDLVVHEMGEVAVRLAAEVAGVPGVGVSPSLTLASYVTAMAAGVAELRASLGLDADPEGLGLLTGPALSWFPATFDVPEAAAYDVRRFRDTDLPAPTEPADRSLVYVTLGSEAAAMPFFADALRQTVAGALRADLPVVVSTGRPVAPEILAGLDGDLRVEPWVVQAAVLAQARVVVCHAGSGTTLGALAAGVPVVAVPLFADQPYNAERLVATGCGLAVAPGPALADEVAAAVARLIAEPPAGSARIAREIAALPPVGAAVPWLEACATGGA